MNTAEWIIVAILSMTLFVFLVLGIVLLALLIKLTGEAKKVIIKSQDIADNANSIANNIKGMTSIGGAVEMFVDKYIAPKLKEKRKSNKEKEPKNDRETKQ